MEIVKEFGINPILLFAQIVNFTILLVLLRKFLYKPLLKVLEERKVKIAQSLKDAEEIEKRLAKTAEEQEKLLANAKSESNQMVADSKKEAKELSEKTLADARLAVEEILAKNQERLKLEKDQMMKEVKQELAELVTQAAEKVAKKTMNSGDNQRLVAETLKEMETK